MNMSKSRIISFPLLPVADYWQILYHQVQRVKVFLTKMRTNASGLLLYWPGTGGINILLIKCFSKEDLHLENCGVHTPCENVRREISLFMSANAI